MRSVEEVEKVVRAYADRTKRGLRNIAIRREEDTGATWVAASFPHPLDRESEVMVVLHPRDEARVFRVQCMNFARLLDSDLLQELLDERSFDGILGHLLIQRKCGNEICRLDLPVEEPSDPSPQIIDRLLDDAIRATRALVRATATMTLKKALCISVEAAQRAVDGIFEEEQ